MPRNEETLLLAELKGVKGLTHFESVDAGRDVQPDRTVGEDALRVAPLKDDRTLMRKYDDKFSTAIGGKGYRMVVRGEFVAQNPSGQGKVRRPYELAFNVPKLDGALSLIVSKLLLPALRAAYEGVVNYRTHEPVSVEPLSPDMPAPDNLQYFDRDRLERFVEENRVPIRSHEYEKVEDLRESVIDWKLNPVGFEKRDAHRQKARAEMAELVALNPHLRLDGKIAVKSKIAPEAAQTSDNLFT